MPLGPGTRLGAYEVISAIGAGGMGEVYRARDSRLGREVALKILPDDVAADPERLARFEREAHVLATLNHRHIAAIYGLEEGPDVGSVERTDVVSGFSRTRAGFSRTRALVLELVDGETLAEVIDRGPVPVDEAVRLARQIADALEAAHEQGIIHRDLKPANIKVNSAGEVKVLDFGLAKLTSAPDAAGGGSGSMSMSPTMTSPAMLTGATLLLGTASYMAPEQARGKAVDKRADIWAFGVVLYEMLTGTRPFAGESVTEVAGAVIHKEPDWSSLPASLPPTVRMIVRRCMEKDPRQRVRDMGDVRLALDGAFATETAAPAGPPPGATGRRRAAAWSAAVAIALAAATGAGVWMTMRGGAAVERMPLRFDVMPAQPGTLSPLIDISPDGRMLSFVALDEDGTTRVSVRSLETGETRVVTPSDWVRQPPFWSPDSRYLAFFSGGRLKRTDVAGGPAETIADIGPSFVGGSWSTAGGIVYSNVNGIMRVPAAGGDPVALTAMDRARKENSHLLPMFLPDGRHFLYMRVTGDLDTGTGIYIGSIDARPEEQDMTRLVATGQHAAYAPSGSGGGHLLFLRDGLLMAQPFDPDALELSGEAVALAVEPVATSSVMGAFAASANGTVIYRRGGASAAKPVWLDRNGTMTPLLNGTALDRPGNPRLSPDGRRLALIVGGDLWLFDLEGRPPIRLTFGEDPEYSPVWTRDGRRIVYEQGGDSPTTLFAVPADGSGGMPEPMAPEGHFHAHGWSADGEIVATRIAGSGDLVRFAPGPDAAVQQIAGSAGFHASVSTDGRWVAYVGESTGRAEIWVRPVGGPGAPVRVSPNGGSEPLWSRDGRELFYIEDQKLMAVPVTTGAEFNFTPPAELFTAAVLRGQQPPSYDVAPDGRFLMMITDVDADSPISVIVNWPELLRRRTPTAH